LLDRAVGKERIEVDVLIDECGELIDVVGTCFVG
jgi:hypothetical protein